MKRLNFIIYSIAPLPVIEELVEVFTHECMPPHICLIILPSVLHNISDVHSPKLRVSFRIPFISHYVIYYVFIFFIRH